MSSLGSLLRDTADRFIRLSKLCLEQCDQGCTEACEDCLTTAIATEVAQVELAKRKSQQKEAA